MTSDGDPAFWHWALHCAPKLFWLSSDFHDAMHTVKASGARSRKATPKHLWTSTMFDCRDCVLFFEGLISFSVNSTIMCFTKKALLWSHLSTWHSPRRILAFSGNFWQTLVCLFFMSLCQQWDPPGSPTIASHFIQMATDSASWHCCTLCLQVSLNLFRSWLWFFTPFEQSFVGIFLKCFCSVHVQGG